MEGAAEQSELPIPAMAQALTTANALLASSLAAGDVPWTDDEHLKERIRAYRASIEGLSKQLDELGDTAEVGEALQQQQTADQEQAASVPGIGQEGVDYTVSYSMRTLQSYRTSSNATALSGTNPSPVHHILNQQSQQLIQRHVLGA